MCTVTVDIIYRYAYCTYFHDTKRTKRLAVPRFFLLLCEISQWYHVRAYKRLIRYFFSHLYFFINTLLRKYIFQTEPCEYYTQYYSSLFTTVAICKYARTYLTPTNNFSTRQRAIISSHKSRNIGHDDVLHRQNLRYLQSKTIDFTIITSVQGCCRYHSV